VDLAAKRAQSASGTEVRLTPTEWHLLEASSATPNVWSPTNSCCTRSGDRGTRQTRTTCAYTWPTCGANSNPTRAGHATFAQTQAWAFDSRPTARAEERPILPIRDLLSGSTLGGTKLLTSWLEGSRLVPNVEGRNAAPTAAGTRSLSCANTVEAQGDLEGGMHPKTAPYWAVWP
jgi:hypothetical protein